MFKCMFAIIFVVVFANHVHCYPPALSYQHQNLDSSKLLSIVQQPILLKNQISLNHGLGLESSKLGIHGIQQPLLITKDEHDIDYVAYPKYGFQYGVSDSKTGDNKEQVEERDGDIVKGAYSLIEADGTKRTVKYIAGGKTGFNAEVIRSGKAIHPQILSIQKVIEVPSKLGW